MKGPKATISEAIAKALAEHFVVDPTDIETNLIRNAGVTLHQVQLRPRTERLNRDMVMQIVGRVSQVAFHWKWGGSKAEQGGSAWVNSATLTMDGLNFTASLLYKEQAPTTTTLGNPNEASMAITSTTTKPATAPKKRNGGGSGFFTEYIQDQVERIIDTLQLSITDFTFHLELPPATETTIDGRTRRVVRSLSFGGTGVQLDSWGRTTIPETTVDKDNNSATTKSSHTASATDNTTTLTQVAKIANIFASVVVTTTSEVDGETKEEEESETLPLLDPISYQATCVRQGSGKRFGAGLQTGLSVRGESSDDGLVLHTGQVQMKFLNDLGGIMLMASSSGSDNTTTSTSDDVTHDDENVAAGSPVAAVPEKINDLPSSLFELPLAGISLVFPNDTRISMAHLMLRYRMDGKLFCIEGRKGFLVNGFAMLSLGDEGLWQANMVNRQFRVFHPKKSTPHTSTDKDSTTVVACVHARDDEIQHIKSGVRDLLEIYQNMISESSGAISSIRAMESSSKRVVKATPQKSSNALSTKWTIDFEGDLKFLLEGSDNRTVCESWLGGIHASTANNTLTIGSVKKLDIPGTICLVEPLEGSTIQFDGQILDIRVGNIVATLREPHESQKPVNAQPEKMDSFGSDGVSTPPSPESQEAAPFILPFGVKLQIESSVVYEIDGKSIHTTAKNLQAAVGPDSPVVQNNKQTHSGGIRALVMLEEFNHDMISLTEPKVSAIVYPHIPQLIREFRFGADTVAVSAGYSVFDWKRLFATGDEKREKKRRKAKTEKKEDRKKTIIYLPFAHVDPLKVRIAVDGDLVGTKGTTINIAEFDGKKETVLKDLVKFYTRKAAAGMPNMFKDAEVLGFNLSDTASGYVGSAMGTAALGALGSAAAPMASVLGVVGYDSVVNTIKSGKKSRGAATDDKTEFTDFFRGIGQAAKDSAAKGATKRGKKQEEKADALDWALGATTDVAEYANENKSRLGGAGAGAAGFAAGFVLGGPIGGVAAALIASAATSRAIDAVDSKIAKSKKEETVSSSESLETTADTS